MTEIRVIIVYLFECAFPYAIFFLLTYSFAGVFLSLSLSFTTVSNIARQPKIPHAQHINWELTSAVKIGWYFTAIRISFWMPEYRINTAIFFLASIKNLRFTNLHLNLVLLYRFIQFIYTSKWFHRIDTISSRSKNIHSFCVQIDAYNVHFQFEYIKPKPQWNCRLRTTKCSLNLWNQAKKISITNAIIISDYM